MIDGQVPLRAAALTDVVLLVSLAPSSLAPVSVAELHLYAYLANLVALNRGVPLSEWGYSFSVTAGGFPFAPDLDSARENLVERSVLSMHQGDIRGADDPFRAELDLLHGLEQCRRREPWLEGSFACALHLPRGAVRDAINHSPGVEAGIRQRRSSALLSDLDLQEIYAEFDQISDVLGGETQDLLQPVVIWLSARVISRSWP